MNIASFHGDATFILMLSETTTHARPLSHTQKSNLDPDVSLIFDNDTLSLSLSPIARDQTAQCDPVTPPSPAEEV